MNRERISWIKSEEHYWDKEERIYSLDWIKENFEVREVCKDGYLVLNWGEDPDRLWLKFAVLSFDSSQVDDSKVMLSLIFHGEGPSSNLREFRHTWWGDENGYIFYANPKVICSALLALSEFYDFNDWPSKEKK